ncbi:unnamed protein product [Rotaria socialis]|uniref:Uncharacterized protein n=1 Tax=Rotaria socialis TaxID=392032 RepID=A0A820W0J4_9BILA|nr:unnamed protein product [Rotaria socialis]CAF4507648.1 unnamed protein product [Rotaria socialis]
MLWNNDLRLNPALNIEEHIMVITNSIMLTTEEAVPTSTQQSKSYALSEASKSLITMKHQAYRRRKRTGNNIDKRQYYKSKILSSNSLRNDRDSLNKLMYSLCHKKCIQARFDLQFASSIAKVSSKLLHAT